VKIRVILISALILVQHLGRAQKQEIKDKTTYYLSAIFIENKKNQMAKNKGHIVFNASEKIATCFTSCNFIQLKYSQNNQNLKFTTIRPADEPCPDPLVGLESDIKENLPKVSNFSIKGNRLILFSKKDTLMVFVEAGEGRK
jgi:heat shock protein HslJ